MALTVDTLLTAVRTVCALEPAPRLRIVFTTTALKDSSERPYSVAGRMYQSGLPEHVYPDLVAGGATTDADTR